MKIAKIILAGSAALTIISSAAFAQQALTGTITQVDRINRTVLIKQTQSGTTGANIGGAAEEFKAEDSLSLDTLHAGDKISFSATENGWNQDNHETSEPVNIQKPQLDRER